MENKEECTKMKYLLRYIGLARKAGALAAGVNLVVAAVQKRKAQMVFYSEDISEQSLKKLKDKSAFYNTEIYMLCMNMDELGKAVGLTRPTAAVCLTDRNFVYPVRKILFPEESPLEKSGEIIKKQTDTEVR